jgi:hypothetical protein
VVVISAVNHKVMSIIRWNIFAPQVPVIVGMQVAMTFPSKMQVALWMWSVYPEIEVLWNWARLLRQYRHLY